MVYPFTLQQLCMLDCYSRSNHLQPTKNPKNPQKHFETPLMQLTFHLAHISKLTIAVGLRLSSLTATVGDL